LKLRGRNVRSDTGKPSRWIFKRRINELFEGWSNSNSLIFNHFDVAKNIFEKMAKIPRGNYRQREVWLNGLKKLNELNEVNVWQTMEK
jgi:hypothetical protein